MKPPVTTAGGTLRAPTAPVVEPFDGPLSVRFGDEVHVLGGTLTQAMRAEVGA